MERLLNLVVKVLGAEAAVRDVNKAEAAAKRAAASGQRALGGVGKAQAAVNDKVLAAARDMEIYHSALKSTFRDASPAQLMGVMEKIEASTAQTGGNLGRWNAILREELGTADNLEKKIDSVNKKVMSGQKADKVAAKADINARTKTIAGAATFAGALPAALSGSPTAAILAGKHLGDALKVVTTAFDKAGGAIKGAAVSIGSGVGRALGTIPSVAQKAKVALLEYIASMGAPKVPKLKNIIDLSGQNRNAMGGSSLLDVLGGTGKAVGKLLKPLGAVGKIMGIMAPIASLLAIALAAAQPLLDAIIDPLTDGFTALGKLAKQMIEPLMPMFKMLGKDVGELVTKLGALIVGLMPIVRPILTFVIGAIGIAVKAIGLIFTALLKLLDFVVNMPGIKQIAETLGFDTDTFKKSEKSMAAAMDSAKQDRLAEESEKSNREAEKAERQRKAEEDKAKREADKADREQKAAEEKERKAAEKAERDQKAADEKERKAQERADREERASAERERRAAEEAERKDRQRQANENNLDTLAKAMTFFTPDGLKVEPGADPNQLRLAQFREAVAQGVELGIRRSGGGAKISPYSIEQSINAAIGSGY